MWSAVGVLLGSFVAVVATPETATALPGGCTHTWDGSTDSNWGTAANWDVGSVPGPTSVACIPSFFTVFVNGNVHVGAVHIDNADLDVGPGDAFFVDGPATSVWAPSSFVSVFQGMFGGSGPIEVHGTIEFSGESILSSVFGPTGVSYAGVAGSLNIASDGELRVPDNALGVRARYHIDVSGLLDLGSDAFITADWGTSTTIQPSGVFNIGGDGGYYQGFPVPGQPLSVLTNHGMIGKTSGNATSIVEAAYVQGPTASLMVDCCATLALAASQQLSGQVDPGMALATGACGLGTLSLCAGSVDPAVDVMSVKLQIPGSNTQTAGVQLQELTQPPPTTDSRAIGNEVFAHADQLDVNPLSPATLTLRFSQADVMATPLAEIQVGHISDAGVMTKTPDCISGAIPPGAAYCVDRAQLSRTTQNTFVTVRTTQTSRWRVRRNLPGESFDQTAPGAPQGFSAKLAAPFDGSAVALSWSPPGNDGGAAPTAYRVFRDGTFLTATSGGTSVVVKDSGPGKHVFTVSAVNVIGQGAAASATITLDKLSKPRKVKALRGASGGKLTAGAKWKAPADSGGYAITKYKVAVFKANGKKVDTKVVKADKLKYLFKLRSGRYYFRVKARNSDRWGPWSKPTDLVRPR